jgi:hypothetical protein
VVNWSAPSDQCGKDGWSNHPGVGVWEGREAWLGLPQVVVFRLGEDAVQNRLSRSPHSTMPGRYTLLFSIMIGLLIIWFICNELIRPGNPRFHEPASGRGDG